MQIFTRTAEVLFDQKSQVEKQLAKLNKRAVKLNVPSLTWTWGEPHSEERTILYQDPYYADEPPYYKIVKVVVIPIELTGVNAVSFDGWEFLATIQHLPTGENILRACNTTTEIPKHYRNVSSDCDHCRVKRYRKDTYLLYKATGDTWVQVGSSCLKDFLGHNCPDDILARAGFLSELNSYMDNVGSGGGMGVKSWLIEDVLAHTVAVIKVNGWMSKSKADEYNKESTASQVRFCLSPPRDAKAKDIIHPDENDAAKAKLVLEWVENLSDQEVESSDYLYNIRAIARAAVIENRTMGFAVSIVPAYDRAIAAECERKHAKVSSKHVGEIKQRQNFTLTLFREFVYDGMYGTTHKYIFRDQEGNTLVWAASKNQNLEVDSTYEVIGTVKDHVFYKEIPQTLITRCSVKKG